MIELKNITKYYGELMVYKNFNISFEDGKVTAILGVSGCGKTTLLNIIAKLTSYEGEILGKVAPISYVFQNDRLIPNLTVKQNLELVVKNKDIDEALIKAGLSDFLSSYPKELSGGMARRVSILRAFLYDASLMLLDEPFKDLDLGLKYKLIDYFKFLRENNSITTLFITHDIKEAVYLADRVVIIDKNQIRLDLEIPKDDKSKADVEEILFKTMLEL